MTTAGRPPPGVLAQAELDNAEACIVKASLHIKAALDLGLASAAAEHAGGAAAILEAARAGVERAIKSHVGSNE